VSTAYWEKYVWNPAELEWGDEEVTAAGFDPNQPRDEIGRWSETGAEARTDDAITMGSARDPGWEGPVVGPGEAYWMGDTFDAVDHSDRVWAGEEISYMGYGIYEDEFDHEDYQDEGYRQRVSEEFAEIMRDGAPALSTPAGEVLDDILESGRFKNQFETGTSGGALSPDGRMAQEEMFFGYASDTPAEERPIYGWVDHPDSQNNQRLFAQYGILTWRLKDEVKGRATVTSVDSLSRPVVPGPWRNPGWRATLPAGYHDGGLLSYATSDPLHDTGLFDDVLEAQYHGGLSLDDVASLDVVVYEGFEPEEVLTPEQRDRLRQRGIKVRYVSEYGAELGSDS
jgi:hypothetical protein